MPEDVREILKSDYKEWEIKETWRIMKIHRYYQDERPPIHQFYYRIKLEKKEETKTLEVTEKGEKLKARPDDK